VAEAAELIYQDAGAHMLHFLDNTGSTYTIRYSTLISDVQSARTVRNTEIDEALAFSETINKDDFDITSTSATTGYATKTESANWYYAVGGYSAFGKGRVKRCNENYKMTFTLKFRDRYNWDTGKGVTINGIVIPDTSLGRLHAVGIAQEFNMVGEVTYIIKWKKGQRTNSGAVATGGR
jgi:hypothetical protein